MKKILSILFVSALIVSLNACSGNDDGDNNGGGGNNDEIVGTWKLYGDMVDGEITSDNIEPCDDEIYQFQANGNLKVTEKFCGEPSDVYNINWEKSGDNLYKMVAEGQVIEAFYVVFSEDGQYAYHYESVEEMQTQSYAEVFKRS